MTRRQLLASAAALAVLAMLPALPGTALGIGLELPLALWIDFVLPKQRILEIYLNIAEMGPAGQFGAEAGAQYAFGRSAAALSTFTSSQPDPPMAERIETTGAPPGSSSPVRLK